MLVDSDMDWRGGRGARHLFGSRQGGPGRALGAPLGISFGLSLVSASPEQDDEESADLEIDEIRIDEASLPALDTEDPEALVLERAHDDLLDRRWLERPVDEEDDDERSALEDVGVTIELNASGAEDEAEVVELDIGELLEPQSPGAGDDELGLGGERGDGAFGLAALRDMLLPEREDEHEDGEIGDDERFPVFDDGGPAWRAPPSEDDGPEGEPS